jgi:hypothetical protein
MVVFPSHTLCSCMFASYPNAIRAARGVGAAPHRTSVTMEGTTSHCLSPPRCRHGRLPRPSTTCHQSHLHGAAALQLAPSLTRRYHRYA